MLICKQIRNLAKLGRVSLCTDCYSIGRAKNLLNYLDYVGINPQDYIKEYLENIQPYMLQRDLSKEPNESYISVIDNMYAISLYIKGDVTEYQEVVVSFHESHGKGGIAKKNLMRTNPERKVPVFADRISSINRETKEFFADVFIQRGLLTLPLYVQAVKCEDFFLVRERDISVAVINYCNRYIEELYSSKLNLNFDEIEIFSILQQMPFTVYGNDVFSTISLLIDSLNIQNDVYSKREADFALITFLQNLKLTKEQKDELMEILYEKYSGRDNRERHIILNRIEDSLEIIKYGMI